MSARKKQNPLPKTPLTVGTIHSQGSLSRALRLKPGQVDLLELRVDHFADDMRPLLAALSRLAVPLIVTVRHPAEGGAGGLSSQRRLELFREFMPTATYLDVELRSCERFLPIIEEGRAQGVRIIVSDHHFRATPPSSQVQKRVKRARDAGADIFKFAAHVARPADLARLLGVLAGEKRQPLSMMGMGPYGKVSRLLFARAGSILNYGYLNQPQVPGQWEATMLKARISELFEQ